MSVNTANDADFNAKVMEASTPVLVAFTSTTCGPCKAMKPAIRDLSAEYEGELEIYYVDIDESPVISAHHAIRGVPTYMIFKKGQITSRLMGSMSRSQLAAAVETGLKAEPTSVGAQA